MDQHGAAVRRHTGEVDIPHASVKLRPGTDVNSTPALNEAGISSTQLVRFLYDRTLGALIQKLGGWERFYPATMPAIVRALWAWEDTQAITHLAYGTENIGATSEAQLGVIIDGSAQDITPRYVTHTLAPVVSTTSGSSIVTITDTVVTNISQYDSVYIPTQIAVGGLVLFGSYACNPDGHSAATTYTIQAVDALGAPLAATSSSSSPVLPNFTTVSGASAVTVTLPAHGFTANDAFPVLLSTTVGGTTFLGHFPVLSVTDANNFVVTALTTPTSSTSGYLNAGNAYFIYSHGLGSGSVGSGYGRGGYGRGGYGTGVATPSPSGTPVPAYDWVLDNWGEKLIAVALDTEFAAPAYQPIYQWDSEDGAPLAAVIPQAPVVNDGIFVAMPQRQIVAWGSTFTGIQDPLLIRWCDVNNFNVWLGTVINQAGSFRLPKGSKIVSGIQGPQQALLWTDLGVWSMQYIGQPYVYSFNEIGAGCGLIARKAVAILSGDVFWMGPSQFYMLSGDGVQTIACPIWDVVFQNLNPDNIYKIRVAVNSRFGEIAWYYPSADGGGEVDSYIKYNVPLQAWDYGTLGRSAWIDQSVLGPPIGADPSSLYLYQHETSPDADGQAMVSGFRTGYYAMSEADVKMFVDQVWPDAKWGEYGGAQSATLNLTFYVVDYPGQTPTEYGPYALTQSTTFITPRFRGRLVSLGFESDDIGSWWRLGLVRYRACEDGRF